MKKFLTGLAVGAVVLTGCAAGPTGTPVVPLAAPGPVVTTTPVPPGPITLGLTSTALGEILTSDGWTVYRFEADTPDPPASLCENDCVAAWPP
ncbi:MAG: hypothetical protein H7Y15_16395, partial [Pseudonocardia sp.]|nr:hypothetical protein [Pseudonocardia sp.]